MQCEIEDEKIVCSIYQRYKFKSKSQLKRNKTIPGLSVFDISKIQIKYQFCNIVVYAELFSCIYRIFNN